MLQIGAVERAGLSQMRIALYQPDIPQNAGTIIRLAACTGTAVHIIDPAGFDISSRALRRAAMDYFEAAQIFRHASFTALKRSAQMEGSRVILLTTRAETPYYAIKFQPSDILLAGRESAGVPDDVHAAVDERVCIPMRQGLRSMNVAVAVAMVLGEALKQTGGFPRPA